MAETAHDCAQELKDLASKYQQEVMQQGEQAYVYVDAKNIVDELTSLKEKGFEVLTDLTTIDTLGQGEPSRFIVIYQLLNTKDFKTRIRLRSRVGDDEIHPSVSHVFPAAGFAEREVYDMFGVVFEGHPNLKRLLCPDNFEGHPLRKDFPLQGRGFRDDFPNYHRDLLEEEK